jgi:lysophospholipase L1-like esterase
MARRPVTRRTRLLALLVIAALQFVLFEAALRTWGSSEAAPAFQGLFTDDPVVGYRLNPGAETQFTTREFSARIKINGSGVRDDEEVAPKAPGERRIVILGDSLVLSVQVDFDQTFGELLESRLNADALPGVRYRVINAGVQGYGPVQELLFFRSIGPLLEPDVVLTVVFVGNDAEEAYASRARLAGGDRPASDAAAEAVVTRVRRTVRRSMVLQIARLRAVAATERFANWLSPPEPPLQSYAANPAPRIGEGIEVTRECLQQIASGAATLGAQSGVVLMPARFQVDDEDYGHLKEAVERAGGEMRRDGATERFAASLAPLGLPVFDALPPLRGALPGARVFYADTVHLTPRGHEVVAAGLESFLRTSGLLDERPASIAH